MMDTKRETRLLKIKILQLPQSAVASHGHLVTSRKQQWG